jgi:foldase protein PrsA
MFKHLMTLLVLVFLLIGCGSKKTVTLEKGTPLYNLAKEFATTVPAMDPDANKALVTCKNFTITPASFLTELQRNMGKNMDQLKTFDKSRMAEFFRSNIERLAERDLLLEDARKSNITVPSAELDSTLAKIYKQNGGQEAFAKRISEDGITLDVVRTDVERNMILKQYFEKKNADLKVSEDELAKAYNEDKTASVRHILLMTQGQDDVKKAETRARMQGILDRARKGEDFAKLAKEYSEDPGSKNNGGLYSDFGKGQMVKPFEDAAFTVPVGGLSDIVETQYGFHILQVVDRKKETLPMEQVKADMEQNILRSKRRELQTTLLEKLKKDAGYKIEM